MVTRPLGPGYDKGREERLREEVDHRYRCNYFKWSTEVKKEALKDTGIV
jgi:AP endonuclease-2